MAEYAVKRSLLPIAFRYLKSISTEKYTRDTSIINHIDVNLIKTYGINLDKDTLILKENLKDFESALLSSVQLDSFVRKNETGKYIQISKPLFSINMNYALVEVDYHCFGLCGEGYTYILKKKDNVWVLYQKLFRWVS